MYMRYAQLNVFESISVAPGANNSVDLDINLATNSVLTLINFVGVFQILINIGGFCSIIYFMGYLIFAIGVNHGFQKSILKRIMSFNEGRS